MFYTLAGKFEKMNASKKESLNVIRPKRFFKTPT
jgi:hypothetical protein